MKMHSVIHFEMPTKNKKRVAKFYTAAFGWNMQIMGKEFGGYLLATTTPSTDKGPKKPGAINGGFWETKKKEPPHFVISVDDLKKHIAVVKKAGGKILGKPQDIPGIGNFVMIEDTEGNKVGMLQPASPNRGEPAAI